MQKQFSFSIHTYMRKSKREERERESRLHKVYACTVHPRLRVRVLTRGWVCSLPVAHVYTQTNSSLGRPSAPPPTVALSFIHNVSVHKRAKVYVQPRPQRGRQHMHSLPPPFRSGMRALSCKNEERLNELPSRGCGLHFRRLYPAGTRDLLGLHA